MTGFLSLLVVLLLVFLLEALRLRRLTDTPPEPKWLVKALSRFTLERITQVFVAAVLLLAVSLTWLSASAFDQYKRQTARLLRDYPSFVFTSVREARLLLAVIDSTYHPRNADFRLKAMYLTAMYTKDSVEVLGQDVLMPLVTSPTPSYYRGYLGQAGHAAVDSIVALRLTASCIRPDAHRRDSLFVEVRPSGRWVTRPDGDSVYWNGLRLEFTERSDGPVVLDYSFRKLRSQHFPRTFLFDPRQDGVTVDSLVAILGFPHPLEFHMICELDSRDSEPRLASRAEILPVSADLALTRLPRDRAADVRHRYWYQLTCLGLVNPIVLIYRESGGMAGDPHV